MSFTSSPVENVFLSIQRFLISLRGFDTFLFCSSLSLSLSLVPFVKALDIENKVKRNETSLSSPFDRKMERGKKNGQKKELCALVSLLFDLWLCVVSPFCFAPEVISVEICEREKGERRVGKEKIKT
jgi:hypothetical protein